MLDKRGRIFGKISIIDLLVVLIVLVAVVGGFISFQKINQNLVLTENKGLIKNNATDMLEVTLRVEEVRQVTVDAIEVGDDVYMDDTGKYFGEITNIEVLDATKLVYDLEGNPKEAVIPTKFDVLLTISAPGKETGTGFYTADNIQLVHGTELKIITPKIKTGPTIESLKTKAGE